MHLWKPPTLLFHITEQAPNSNSNFLETLLGYGISVVRSLGGGLAFVGARLVEPESD
jgi:hypothetical protein